MLVPAALPAPDRHSRLLAALPDGVRRRLVFGGELVDLLVGDRLECAGEPNAWAYFPTSGIVSLLGGTVAGTTLQVGMIGRDGMVGLAGCLGGDWMIHEAVVQVAGEAWRLPRKVLKAEFDQGGALQRVLLLYGLALVAQMGQAALCHRLHDVSAQVVRWLLMSRDRQASDKLPITHDALANLLGVRREGVSVVAHKLQAAGWIHYRRGLLTILDRAALAGAACECYEVVRQEEDRLAQRMRALHQGADDSG